MIDDADKRRLAEAVFGVTGQKLPEDDPLVVAALYYASSVRLAGDDAAQAVNAAGERVASRLEASVETANAAIQRAVAEALAGIKSATDEAQAATRATVDDARAATRAAVEDAQAAARGAGKAADTVSTVAVSVSRQAAVHQATFIDILDRRLPWSGGKPASTQSLPVSGAARPRWQFAAAGALASAIFVAVVNFVACGYSFSWVHDASIGRQFLGALPYLDHDLKARLLSDLEKLQPRK